jgi:acyl-CoA reductase-like NAD-dependent aldehyde dehydrogenase
VTKLRNAYDAGRTRPIEWRRRQLESMKTMLAEREAELLDDLAAELGGKSPTIVDDSANVEVAARRIAFGKFLNAGPTRIDPKLAYPPYTRVKERLVRRFL